MSELRVFDTFPTMEQAQRVAALLENNELRVAVEELQGPLDTNFLGQQFSNPFLLKIPGDKFKHARTLLMKHTVVDISEVDEEYMLLEFTDQELLDVLAAPDDWGVYNYKLAEALLKQRGGKYPRAETGGYGRYPHSGNEKAGYCELVMDRHGLPFRPADDGYRDR